MPDEFERVRDAMIRASNGNSTDPSRHAKIAMLLDNQREMMATLSLLIRGGRVPMSIAKDLQERAKKIRKILEG